MKVAGSQESITEAPEDEISGKVRKLNILLAEDNRINQKVVSLSLPGWATIQIRLKMAVLPLKWLRKRDMTSS
ncbi:MAG: hypothetical protein R2727_08210 [Bacteroidales bacterium]